MEDRGGGGGGEPELTVTVSLTKTEDVDAANSKCGIWASTTSRENSMLSCYVTIAIE